MSAPIRTDAADAPSSRALLLSGVLAAVALATMVFVWWWPTARGHDVDVVVIGDAAVRQSSDELLRRLRQEGMVPEVVVLSAAECADATGSYGDARVVLSFSSWVDCPSSLRAALLVQQPGGAPPTGASASDGVRPAAPLFNGGDQEDCLWWDTPGAGEDRPGLGQCDALGKVTVLAEGRLTAAGRERFARLIVEALA
jgi:hypothetical protein